MEHKRLSNRRERRLAEAPIEPDHRVQSLMNLYKSVFGFTYDEEETLLEKFLVEPKYTHILDQSMLDRFQLVVRFFEGDFPSNTYKELQEVFENLPTNYWASRSLESFDSEFELLRKVFGPSWWEQVSEQHKEPGYLPSWYKEME